MNRPGAAQGEAALRARRRHRDAPSVADVAEHGIVADVHVVEEHLGEALVAVEATEAAHRDPRCVEGDEEVGEPMVALGLRIGAEQPKYVGAEGATRRPRLLAREPPAALDLVAHGLALDPGEIAPGIRLRPALAPEVHRARHAGEDLVPLLLGPESEHRRGEEEDPVLGHALRPARPVVLLFEDEPLHRGRVAPAVRLGPRDDRPAGIEERTFPVEVEGEPLGGVARREPMRHVGLEPLTTLGPERVLGIAEGQVHGERRYPRAAFAKAPGSS